MSTNKRALETLEKLIGIKKDLRELLELLEISKIIFREKIERYKKDITIAKNSEKIQETMAEAEKIYQEYRIFLEIIKKHIEKKHNKLLKEKNIHTYE
ncbi:hypothetical protein C4577_04610 [Candidatus Parcubacteria bacterium]|nr:MAG: hypothetical protein C4577_04610 [Candidatus Parcubacteria bacterium]